MSASLARNLAYRRPRSVWLRLRAWSEAMVAAADERQELLWLDDHLLADIGVDRLTATTEARRPFWDLGGTPRRR